MEGPLYHFFVVLPIFAVVLMLVVIPILQWVSTRLLDRRFVFRFSGAWNPESRERRWDVVFSLIAFVLSLGISFIILQALILEGILHPVN